MEAVKEGDEAAVLLVWLQLDVEEGEAAPVAWRRLEAAGRAVANNGRGGYRSWRWLQTIEGGKLQWLKEVGVG